MLFALSANVIAKQNNEMISIKITGLLDMRVLKKWNESVELRDVFWTNHSHNGILTYQNLLSGLKQLLPEITEQ